MPEMRDMLIRTKKSSPAMQFQDFAPFIQEPPRQRGRLLRVVLLCTTLILIAGGFIFVLLFPRTPETFTITLPEGSDRARITEIIGSTLGWSQHDKQLLASTWAQMQWAAYNREVTPIFAQQFSWKAAEQEAFSTQSTRYLAPEYDFFAPVYASGSYTIASRASTADIADVLVSRTTEAAAGNISAYLAARLDPVATKNAANLVRSDVELLPDLVPLPAKDVRIDVRGNDLLLSFSTIYFNQGKGPLELVADPATKGIRADITRNVLQRIYRSDGHYRDAISGTFLWHQEHLHYHFDDFIIYDLEAVEVENPPDLSGVRTKSTFCIRDVSLVDKNYSIEHRAEKAKYLICGKELQGISVGWGDTYFFNYVDQNLNITDLPSGTYRLSFIANPDSRFEESNMENNTSSVLLKLDMKARTVKVLSEEPPNLPAVEHIYEEQQF